MFKVYTATFTSDGNLDLSQSFEAAEAHVIEMRVANGVTLTPTKKMVLPHARVGQKHAWIVLNQTGFALNVGGPTGAVVAFLAAAVPRPVLSNGVDFI